MATFQNSAIRQDLLPGLTAQQYRRVFLQSLLGQAIGLALIGQINSWLLIAGLVLFCASTMYHVWCVYRRGYDIGYNGLYITAGIFVPVFNLFFLIELMTAQTKSRRR